MLLASGCAVSLASCADRGDDTHRRSAGTKVTNVILLLVDTLRADHLSCYGWSRPTSPAIDAFAGDSLLFEHARSQAACTFPSANAILTSRYGALFMFQPNHFMGIPAGTPALPEILQNNGYATAAFSASPIVRTTPSRENPDGGFGRGFEVFDETCLFRDAECLNTRAVGWVKGTDRPFFLYMHFMETHDPYSPPRSHARRFAGELDGPSYILRGDPNPIADMVYDNGPKVAVTEQDIGHLRDLYDEEIAYFDEQFSRLMEELALLGALDNSLVILASDHGEEFMEHGDHIKHCRVLYDTSTRVPLIIRIPGIPGRRIDTAVGNVDIMPTVLDYLGITHSEIPINGRSLRPLIEGTDRGSRVVFSDQGRWRAADNGDFKLMLEAAEMRPALFDLKADPLERNDILQSQPQIGRQLWLELERWLVATEGSVGSRKALEAGAETQERLQALGYLQ